MPITKWEISDEAAAKAFKWAKHKASTIKNKGVIMPNPSFDGVDHINIYSKGSTELGRFLSNFTHCPIIIADGPFASIEGYWYWIGSGDERLRTLYGYNAKKVGKKLPRTQILTEEAFHSKIRDACWIKVHSQQSMLTTFTQSTLPFTHYYAYGNKVIDAGYRWLVEMWEQYRAYIKNNYIT